jgi:hypothetical protein
MAQEISFLGVDQSFPEGTTGAYLYTVNGIALPLVTEFPYSTVFEFPVGDNVITVALVDAVTGGALSAEVSKIFSVAVPVLATVTLLVPTELVVSEVVAVPTEIVVTPV